MQSPVALELVELPPSANISQPIAVVSVRPSTAVWREANAIDLFTVFTLSTVSITVVYASPPVTGVNTQRFAKCSGLRASSSTRLMSLGPRASPSSRSCRWRAASQWTSLCRKLGRCHFLKCQLTDLRLPPADRAKTKMRHLWPFRRTIFAPVCAQMRWMHPSASPAPMMSPASPYCTLRISASKRAVSHPLDPW